MDSPALISRLRLHDRFLPLFAVFTDDVRLASRHWALILWGILTLLVAINWIWNAPTSGNSAPSRASTASVVYVDAPTTSEILGKLIRVHLLLWTTLVIALSASAVSSEVDFAAESVFCRGIPRWHYLFGKLAGRMAVSVAALWAFTLPVVAMACLRLENDLTIGGVFRLLWGASLMLSAVSAVSVAIGSWFRNPLLAAASAWMTVYGLGIAITLLDIQSLSPTIYISALTMSISAPAAALAVSQVLFALGILAAGTFLVSVVALSMRDY